jgi:hypothetical protein
LCVRRRDVLVTAITNGKIVRDLQARSDCGVTADLSNAEMNFGERSSKKAE